MSEISWKNKWTYPIFGDPFFKKQFFVFSMNYYAVCFLSIGFNHKYSIYTRAKCNLVVICMTFQFSPQVGRVVNFGEMKFTIEVGMTIWNLNGSGFCLFWKYLQKIIYFALKFGGIFYFSKKYVQKYWNFSLDRIFSDIFPSKSLNLFVFIGSWFRVYFNLICSWTHFSIRFFFISLHFFLFLVIFFLISSIF